MHSALALSRRAAAVSMRILGGERAGDIKFPPSDFAPAKYDWRELRRWNISENRLPPGSEIQFRELSAWERYSWQIASIGAVILIQAGLISILLEEHRRRRLAEVQARDRMRELARVNRYSTAGELTASIAHEINQPLGSILANAERAQAIPSSPGPDIDELNSIVDDIIHDNRRASEVIRRMRSLLKKTPFEAKKFDFNEVVGDAVDFLSAFAVGRKVALEKATTPDALPVIGDRIQLQQVLINLMVNAFEALADARSVDRRISMGLCASRICRAFNLGQRSGHSGRQAERGLRTVRHQQGRRNGHGSFHCADHRGSARRTDMGQKPVVEAPCLFCPCRLLQVARQIRNQARPIDRSSSLRTAASLRHRTGLRTTPPKYRKADLRESVKSSGLRAGSSTPD